MKLTSTTNTSELPQVLGGLPPGTTIRIEGYVDTDGVTKDLTVATLGPDGYKELQRQSLQILGGISTPVLPGFEPEVAQAALEAMKESLTKSLTGDTGGKEFKEPYVADPAGGFSRKPGTDDAVYLLRMEVVSETLTGGTPKVSDKKGVAQAKAALAKSLNLPTERYIHTIKLTGGKFTRVSTV